MGSMGVKRGRYPVSHIARLRMGSDGKGIRTLILFQQCPLRCKYCINPFTWNESEGTHLLTSEEIYKRVLQDRLYLLATNGGITFGGGEPLIHSKGIKEIAEENVEKFSIFAETSLHVPRKNLEEVIDVIDMYYVDIKTTDPQIYKKYTGGELQIPLDNLKWLINTKGADRVVVRIPLIPGFTDEEQQKGSENLLRDQFGIKQFDLFTYRVL